MSNIVDIRENKDINSLCTDDMIQECNLQVKKEF